MHRFDGIGLRPYPIVHLRGQTLAHGMELSWIRCTRIDGDIWDGVEVPLGEDSESYLVRVFKDGVLVREETVQDPAWTYSAADVASEIGIGAYEVSVAQISARFGAGPAEVLQLSA